MRSLRDNLAFILLGIFAVVLVFFMLRLQNLIMTTQQPEPTAAVNAPETLQQQPTVLIVATATNTPEPPPTDAPPPTAEVVPADEQPAAAQPTLNSSGYQVYGSLVIGAIHVGSVDDRGYNQAHDEGLQEMVERIPDVRVISAENIPETEEVLGVIDQMIQQGAKIIFAQSFGYLPFVVQAAEEHPDIVFLHPGGFELRPNLGTYWANNYEAMYLAGIAAGANTVTNELGFITAFPIPNILASVNAFHLGARSVNPNVQTHLVINESWVAPDKEAQAVNALAASNVDVVTMIVDSPTVVVQTAEALGMFTIGFHSSALQELAPNRWLTGVAYTWGNYYTTVVQQIRSGQWQASHVRGGIESDMLQLAPFGPSVSEETRNRIIAARTDIIRGQLQIFQGPIVDNQGLERIPAGRAGGLELLDTTDWLVEGVTQLDATAVDVEAIPLLPTPTQSIADAGATEEEAPTEAPEPTATPVPVSASTADLILGETDHHAACTFFSELTAQMIRDQFDLDVEIVKFGDDDEMYGELANRQNQRTVDITVCYGDPDDRPYLREYFGFLKHIGDVYWNGPDVRLQVLTNAGYSTDLERNQTCLYRFLKNLHFEGEELLAQTPADWIAANQATVSEWANCELAQ
ncbi:MAG TPA: BMP family ABC transporter substrate-binding protein [Caldilineaceae bacterium]|nr:BMP family ABC transporter substrate-binding protein [Caldilineaceae bacterium]